MSEAPIALLLIHREDWQGRLVQRLLSSAAHSAFRIHAISDIDEGLDALLCESYAALLLFDDNDNPWVKTFLQGRAGQLHHLPFLVLGLRNDDAMGQEMVCAGADDYLSLQGTSPALLSRSIHYAIGRHLNDEESRPVNAKGNQGVADRGLLFDRLERSASRAARSGGLFGVMYIDLDHFRSVADEIGNRAATQLLARVASRIQSCLRRSDSVASLGSDEYAILVEEVGSNQGLLRVAQKVMAAIADAGSRGSNPVALSGSIGIASYPASGREPQQLLGAARQALQRAKSNDGGNCSFSSQDDNREAMDLMLMQAELGRALRRSEFVMTYAPRVALDSGQLVALEGNIYWQNIQRGGLLAPQFMPAAEAGGLAAALGLWMIRRGCDDLAVLWQRGYELPLALTLPISTMASDDLADTVTAALVDNQLPPKALQITVTEQHWLAGEGIFSRNLDRLSNTGVGLVLEDFGLGASPMLLLSRRPLVAVKLDPRVLAEDRLHEPSLNWLVQWLHSYSLAVVAVNGGDTEGFELASDCGCDQLQSGEEGLAFATLCSLIDSGSHSALH